MRIFREMGLADLFSILNAISGFVGVSLLLKGILNFNYLYFSAFMDGFDGFTANRIGKSRLGKDLDSLADLISFGVFPAIVVVRYGSLLAGSLYLIASVLRLARFNVLMREDFLGLPTVASALTLSCWIRLGLPHPEFLAIVLSLLMICDLEYLRVTNSIVLLVCGFVVAMCFVSEYAVAVLLVMLILYILSPGVGSLARPILKRG